MRHPLRHARRSAVIGIVVAGLALGVSPAFGDDWARDRATAAAVQDLDPAIRTAIVAHKAAPATPVVVATAPVVVGDEFAWGAAVLGLGAGIGAMCALFGCVTLVRSHGRLRSV